MTKIYTKRFQPSSLITVKRLLARLPENHQMVQELKGIAYRLDTGYSGELDVDRVLSEIEFPRGTIILKDITLQPNPQYIFQLDTLIITPTRAIILEIKKYAGAVHFDEQSGKTTRTTTDGKTDKYDCIIHQVIRAKEGLRQWFASNDVNLPIQEVIVMANQRTTMAELPETVPVKYRKQLPRYIRELEELPNQLTTGGIQEIVGKISRSQSTIWRTPACEQYKIDPASLSQGVLCLNCNGVMTRSVGRKFQCQVCRKYGDRELAQSLIDWFLLINRTMNNKQCREFLQLTSKSAASVILRRSKLIRTGNPPASIYTWNYKTRLFHRKS